MSYMHQYFARVMGNENHRTQKFSFPLPYPALPSEPVAAPPAGDQPRATISKTIQGVAEAWAKKDHPDIDALHDRLVKDHGMVRDWPESVKQEFIQISGLHESL